jgi:hypothetical protein
MNYKMLNYTKKMKYYISLIALFFCSFSFAQENKKEEIETMKVAFITRKLNLTPDEARAFWPLYNQYQDELDNIRGKRREDLRAVRDEFVSMSDKEVEKYVENELNYKQAELDLLKKYHILFKKIMPVRKVALLYRAEEDFKRELLRRIQEKGPRR